MLILDKGKKIVEGAVRDLFDSSRILLELEVNNPDIVSEKLLSGDWNQFLKERRQDTFIFQLDREKIPQLHAYLLSIGAQVMALRPKHSLEDYFLSLTTANQHVDSFSN
jgi:ABC-type multidrug transport system ATPase subunit